MSKKKHETEYPKSLYSNLWDPITDKDFPLELQLYCAKVSDILEDFVVTAKWNSQQKKLVIMMITQMRSILLSSSKYDCLSYKDMSKMFWILSRFYHEYKEKKRED